MILAGTNDIFGNIVSMCEIACANGIRPVLCSVLPVKKYKWRPEVTDCAERVMALNTMLEEYAAKKRFLNKSLFCGDRIEAVRVHLMEKSAFLVEYADFSCRYIV